MRRIRLSGLLAVTTLAVATWGVTVAATAGPTSTVVTCGQTLTASTRLANSLSGCHGDGLVIGADDIIIDLAGHSITGVNAAGSEGIADDGHGGVRVRNGVIANFFLNGVALRDAPHSAVTKMKIRKIGAGGVDGDASAGVLLEGSPKSSVTASTVTNDVTAYQSDGVDVLSSAGATVSGNRLANNAWDGAFVLSSPGTRVTANVLDGNQNQGLELNSGSDGSRVAGNHAEGNASSGLVVGAVSGVCVENNSLIGNGDSGLFLFDLRNSHVRGNRARGNVTGIDLEGGQNGSNGNRLATNDTSHNTGTGLVLGDGGNDNVVLANASDANQGPPDNGGGIILVGVTGNVVRGNLVSRNRDVGIGVFDDQPGDTTGNVLEANVAVFNRNHGMSAVAGTVDGGHNIAHGNTPLPNCTGVSCA